MRRTEKDKLLEKEVKHRLQDREEFARVRSRIEAICGPPAEKAFEENTWYAASTPGGARQIRLRRGTVNTLTYKEAVETQDRTKTRIEHSVEVDDLEQARDILLKLGFDESYHYERMRETFRRAGTVICIDRMPFGDFIEIEAGPDEIARMEKELGLDPAARILESYMALGSRAASERGLDPRLITFSLWGRTTATD